MTHLRKIMLEELQRRHYSVATTQRYIRSVERLAQHFHCSPDRLGTRHIREYQAQPGMRGPQIRVRPTPGELQ
jgi:integrase/recombinase XerD